MDGITFKDELRRKNIVNNRDTIKFVRIEWDALEMLLDLDNILADKEKKEELRETLKCSFSGGKRKWIGKLEVKYTNNDKELVENTLYFEFSNYILEFGLKRRNRKKIIYYLRHIHELDISVKNKRKLLGIEDIVLTAEQIDQLLIQGKIHQII